MPLKDEGVAKRVAVRPAQDVLEMLGRDLKIVREAQVSALTTRLP